MNDSGMFMSIRDAQKLQIAIGYCLLLTSVPAIATETGLTAAQARDPFSDSRSTDNQTDYPSVLTAPEFESNVTKAVTPSPATTGAAPAKAQVLKTPLVPATSTAAPLVKSYGLTTPASTSTFPRALVLHENVLLSQGLNQWAKDSGYKMLWNSSKDYLIYSTITFTGSTTDDVLGDLGKLFSSENYGLVIKLYQKNRVLIVDEQ